jgi:hypothetical protein
MGVFLSAITFGLIPNRKKKKADADDSPAKTRPRPRRVYAAYTYSGRGPPAFAPSDDLETWERLKWGYAD